MKALFLCASALLVLAAVSPARADILHLKNGTQLEGKVTVEGTRVKIELEYGHIEFDASQVERIEEKKPPGDEFKERFDKIDPKDAEGYFRLGAWAEEKDMLPKAKTAYEAAVAANGDHAAARAKLGYEKVDGQWLKGDEAMRAKGLVKFEGAWMSPQEREDRLVEMEHKLKAALVETEALREQLEKASATIAAMDKDLRNMAEEIDRLRAETRRPVIVYSAPCAYGVVHGHGIYCGRALCHAPPAPASSPAVPAPGELDKTPPVKIPPEKDKKPGGAPEK